MVEASELPDVLEEIAELEDVLVVVLLIDLLHVHTVAFSEMSHNHQLEIAFFFVFLHLAVFNDVALGERSAAVLDKLLVVDLGLFEFLPGLKMALFQVEKYVFLKLLVLHYFHFQVLHNVVFGQRPFFDEFVEVELLLEVRDLGFEGHLGLIFYASFLACHDY